jgi:hypothetical protein
MPLYETICQARCPADRTVVIKPLGIASTPSVGVFELPGVRLRYEFREDFRLFGGADELEQTLGGQVRS